MRQLTDSAWVLEGPTNIGFIVNDNDVTLIDSGNDKESGRKINKTLKDRGWSLKAIVNTHSNADHIGGNDYLQRNLNCEIYGTSIERLFVESPALETAFLWGGLEVRDLRNKFFHAKPSRVTKIIENDADMGHGMTSISLKGHYFDMIGIMTSDNVLFLADSLFGEDILKKYKIPFIFDVKAYKETIEKVRNTEAAFYVPSHGSVVETIEVTAGLNLSIVKEIEDVIIHILRDEKSFEYILKEICDHFHIDLNIGQYALIGSTIRSFLSYLYDESKIMYKIKDNQMIWSRP